MSTIALDNGSQELHPELILSHGLVCRAAAIVTLGSRHQSVLQFSRETAEPTEQGISPPQPVTETLTLEGWQLESRHCHQGEQQCVSSPLA